MADYEDASVQSRVQCAHRNIFHFLRHLRDIATDLMSDVAPLKQRKRIKRRAPKKNTENTQLICSIVSTNFVKVDIQFIGFAICCQSFY